MTYLSLYFLLILSERAFAQVNLVENGSFKNVATASRAEKILRLNLGQKSKWSFYYRFN